MFDTSIHEAMMRSILRGIYKDPQLQAQLAFKGGTCLYFFHALTRFSTDLDFSVRKGVSAQDVDVQKITGIISKYLTIKDHYDKHFTLYWLGSYQTGQQAIKVEISKRYWEDDQYMVHDFYGMSIAAYDTATQFAHKLCAITDRKQIVNRDLYDTWWLLKQFDQINEAIILERTGKTLSEYLVFLRSFLVENVDQKHILLGLGELLDEPIKDWVRDHLFEDLLFWLDQRISIVAK